ncbi:MAG TPA: hypothetical protein VJ777_16105 [Mycobacterium sp.]|nr:hypothetical protein [Mycobacterium sp.]
MTTYAPDFGAALRPGDKAPPGEVLVHARRIVNKAARGVLELHYDTRTVRLTDLNGDAAMRILTIAREHDSDDPTSRRWAEDCDPRASNALDGWVQFQPDRMLGARWNPERFVPGGEDERPVVYAAFRLLAADFDPARPEDFDRAVVRDYLLVLIDMGALDDAFEPEDDDTDEVADVGEGADASHNGSDDVNVAGVHEPVTSVEPDATNEVEDEA